MSLNKLCAEDLDHAGIVAALDPLFAAYAVWRDRECFGHFTIRAGFVGCKRQRCRYPRLRARCAAEMSRVQVFVALHKILSLRAAFEGRSNPRNAENTNISKASELARSLLPCSTETADRTSRRPPAQGLRQWTM